MNPDPILTVNPNTETLTVERATFIRRFLSWKEGERRFVARYSWDGEGRLKAREEDGEVHLHAYDKHGNLAAIYRLSKDGQVTGRETWERDDQGRTKKRIVRTLEPEATESWAYEHDANGRLSAERRGERVRVEKRDADGRVVEDYFYDGVNPDMVTVYEYDDRGNVVVEIIRDPKGPIHRRSDFGWDEKNRLSWERCRDAGGSTIKDITYAYGSAHRDFWLERVSWTPVKEKAERRRPLEVTYRAFTFREESYRSSQDQEREVDRTIAFPNGVYRGEVSQGVPDGAGVFQYNDESRYEGTFQDGELVGQGRLVWPDGRVMEGPFRKGKLQGRGTCHWPDGSAYEGEFEEGLMHGPGIFTWADGTRFEGLFENGRRTDQGAWERPEDYA